MSIAIIIFVILALYHLYMENFFIPIMQMKTEDELIHLKQKLCEAELDPKAKALLPFLQFCMTNTIKGLEKHNFFEFNLFQKKSERAHPFYDTTDYGIISDIVNTQSKPLKQIINRYERTISEIFLINMFGWILYALPILLLYVCFLGLTALKRSIVKTFSISQSEKFFVFYAGKYERYALVKSPQSENAYNNKYNKIFQE